jgi:hypothetical protein
MNYKEPIPFRTCDAAQMSSEQFSSPGREQQPERLLVVSRIVDRPWGAGRAALAKHVTTADQAQSAHRTHVIMQRFAISVYDKSVSGAGLSEELTMTKSILAITILALTTSGAWAAHHRTHHHQAMNASPAAGAPPPMMMGATSPVMGLGGVNSADHADHVKSLRESGYNPKNDFNENGTIKTQ